MNEILNRINRFFSELKEPIKHPGPLMRTIAGIMADNVEHNFANEGKDVSGGWQPLSPVTISQRLKKKTWPGKILQERGGLAASIQQRSTETEAAVGTNKVYAAIHQYGGVIDIPARNQIINFRRMKSGKNKGRALFSNVGKAHFAQKILRKVGRINIPARPYLFLTDQYSQTIMNTVTKWIIK